MKRVLKIIITAVIVALSFVLGGCAKRSSGYNYEDITGYDDVKSIASGMTGEDSEEMDDIFTPVKSNLELEDTSKYSDNSDSEEKQDFEDGENNGREDDSGNEQKADEDGNVVADNSQYETSTTEAAEEQKDTSAAKNSENVVNIESSTAAENSEEQTEIKYISKEEAESESQNSSTIKSDDVPISTPSTTESTTTKESTTTEETTTTKETTTETTTTETTTPPETTTIGDLSVIYLQTITSGSNYITITWNSSDISDDRFYYILCRKTEGGEFANYDQLLTGADSYTDYNVETGTVYYYSIIKIFATNSTYRSNYEDNPLSGVVFDNIGLNLNRLSHEENELTWNLLPGADSYTIYRNGEYLTTVTGNYYLDVYSFTDGESYTYEIYPIHGSCLSTVCDSKTIFWHSGQ